MNENNFSAYQTVKTMSKPEEFADFIDEYCNVGMKDYRAGESIGKLLQTKHRTIQASIIRFSLGIIIGLSKGVDMKFGTDARNETPIAMGQKIAKMIEDGDLKMGYMI
jgi:hypothetical protein